MPEETNNPFAVTDFYEGSRGSGPRIFTSRTLHPICTTAAAFPNPAADSGIRPALERRAVVFSSGVACLNRCLPPSGDSPVSRQPVSVLPVAVPASRHRRSQGDRLLSAAIRPEHLCRFSWRSHSQGQGVLLRQSRTVARSFQ